MTFWKWARGVVPGKRHSIDTTAAKAWHEASTAMNFYLAYREKYNVPVTPKMWRDDFALGFRDGIAQIHFTIFNKVDDIKTAFRWKQAVIQNNVSLE